MAESTHVLKAQARGVSGRCVVRAEFATDSIGRRFFDHMREWGFEQDAFAHTPTPNLVASELCHALDSGLTSDPETAQKVAAWLAERYEFVPR